MPILPIARGKLGPKSGDLIYLPWGDLAGLCTIHFCEW